MGYMATKTAPMLSVEEKINKYVNEFLDGNIVGLASINFSSASELERAREALERKGFVPTTEDEDVRIIKHWIDLLSKGRHAQKQHLKMSMSGCSKGLHCMTGSYLIPVSHGAGWTDTEEAFAVVLIGKYYLETKK